MLAGFSVSELGSALGLNHSTVSQWELGLTNPRREHLERMADLYDMPLELLLYEIGYDIKSPPSLRQWYKARVEAAEPTVPSENFPDNRRAGGPVRTVRGEVIRKDGAAGGGVIQSYPGPAVRELALASR
jgi:transcriptional regulator with XRE-family HTH domain